MATPTFQPADHLHSRTFIGLLIAQFLAAFNDQAIHASAMFYAINLEVMSERSAIALMPILFYAPWAIFCTLAGYLADRYSKRHSLVFWKVAELAITLVALAGLWLGRNDYPYLGAALVLSTVFLMGTHSAFFVPAKYGAMPEILTDRMLSRGNGILESLSFLAVILGTVVGMVALGIGVGSPLVGFLSGGKVEVGLVPVGAVGMVLATTLAALLLANVPVLIGCIVLIGFFTGFYLVPLFTLLQHRAPKTSKGDAVATSNFINVTGAILASAVFFTADWTARHTGLAPPLPESGSPVTGELAGEPKYRHGQ